VYFGSDQTPPTKVAAAITTTTYSPGTLAASTVYYWRVVANYPSGSAPSPMWSFNTLAAALTITKTHVGNFRPGQQNAAYAIVVSNPAGAGVTNANQPLVTVNETLPDSLTLVSMSGSGWSCSGTGCSRTDALAAGASYPPITVTVNVASNAPAQVTNNVNVQWYAGASWVRSYGQDITNILPAPVLTTALGFFPLTPCRMVDTRASQHKTGAFGPPALVGYTGRNFPLLDSGCAIPNTAQAYSVNATVVPPGALDFLSAWPAGKPFPNVSTLNSPDGSTLANAAILPAGTNGAVTVTAGQSTDLILDINGYFAPPNGQELVFYPVTPCRVADTRTTQGKTGAFGPPALSAYTGRNFTFADSNCGVPGTAQAYSLNMTVVPHGALDFLSAWPANKPFPNVSTLNSPDGSVIANAAIVPAGSNGAITVTAGNPTDLIIDVNGYFAPPGAPGALHFYALSTPCRIADTRPSQGQVGSFGPPALAAYSGRSFPVLSSACNIPATAQAYALNVTAIPSGQLDFLSIWPAGKPFPNVSTLNAPKGLVLANAAIVPAGTNGAIMLTAGNPTDIVIDINGYFAP
jgi:hypothetical protein